MLAVAVVWAFAVDSVDAEVGIASREGAGIDGDGDVGGVEVAAVAVAVGFVSVAIAVAAAVVVATWGQRGASDIGGDVAGDEGML